MLFFGVFLHCGFSSETFKPLCHKALMVFDVWFAMWGYICLVYIKVRKMSCVGLLWPGSDAYIYTGSSPTSGRWARCNGHRGGTLCKECSLSDGGLKAIQLASNVRVFFASLGFLASAQNRSRNCHKVQGAWVSHGSPQGFLYQLREAWRNRICLCSTHAHGWSLSED